MRLGGIEAGGTKFVCGIGDENGEILERVSFPTTTPHETIAQVIAFFQQHQTEAIGIGSFGPIDPDPNSPTYGQITTTPKPGWAHYPFLAEMKKHFPIPIGWDTDVNAAVLGEATWGAAVGLDSCIYITVGTGIGGGVLSEGMLVHGLLHPEMGHIPVKHHTQDLFAGSCPYHGDCLEGMASGPAIEKRWGRSGDELTHEDIVWEIEAYYLAQAVVHAILFLSPKRVILGGGVMKQEQLFPLIRQQVLQMLNRYIQSDSILQNIDSYIVAPGLGDNAGLCGALALARQALKEDNEQG